MSRLFNAMTTGDTRTENGMITNSTTSNNVLDMFFKMGGSRNMSERDIERMFSLAYNENKSLALKALFYNRDVREGQGERRSFRIMFKWLCENDPETAKRLVQYVPEFGRWDDLLVGLYSTVARTIADFILFSIKRGDKLCAKWMPRENKSGRDYAHILMAGWNLTGKKYRRLLAGNTQVVETLMCQNEWSAINYNQVPSKASHKYRNAMLKHDELRYREWLGNLSKVDEKGKPLAKVNAGAIFPHDVIRPLLIGSVRNVSDEMIEAQWKALPNYSPSGLKVLPICDISGSMSMGGGLPLLVSVSLGIYTSERNKGIFKNGFITFSRVPTLVTLNGRTLSEKIAQFRIGSLAENTDLGAVFKLILRSAVNNQVPESDMPDTLLILSDMQFDSTYAVTNADVSAVEMARRMYREHGYKLPNIIFWNLNTLSGIPVKYTDAGVAVVSGFSPSILKSILNGEIDPIKQMLAVLLSERYAVIA